MDTTKPGKPRKLGILYIYIDLELSTLKELYCNLLVIAIYYLGDL